ncbi:calcium-binding protein [Bauldia litoralis]|uniref:Hemolysin-type calcium-binding repeat-containing protein n=1 Tax=Bauldia litoralis TaxID=665467 RepID=A0A1G6B6D9_9HYPH|nr:calcium-binding protein [Bauldia litoralis]SDB16214.1 hypothetical protein SAMN02982931_01285 [Bauldia litoralis]
MVTTPTVWKGREQVNQTGTGSQSDVAIIDIGLGRYVAVWTEAAGGPIANDTSFAGSDLVGQIFDAEGNTIGSEFLVNRLRNADNEQDVALAPRVGGGFAAVYEDTDASGTGIVIEFFDVYGSPISNLDIQLDPGTDTLANPSIAMAANGDYLITYERSNNAGDTDIVGKTLSADLVTLGDEFVIFDQDDDATNPEVAALSDGNFVVVFEDEFVDSTTDIDAKMAIVSSAGTVVTTQTVSGGVALEDDPHVAALSGGGFVVVWNDPGSGVVRGQRFDANGTKVGSEFTENFSVEDNPVVAGLSDGRFIVGFEDVDNAPTDVDIHATIFDPRTSPINGDGNANVITSRKDGATVNGLGGSDTLLGQAQADILNGGTGADLMLGRGGDDTYFVDNAGDMVSESAGQGTDTVVSSISYLLGDNVENLGLSGTANISGTGNGLANILVGNSGNNALFGGDGADGLDGGAGADDMRGGTGDDTYFVDNAGDGVTEFAGQGTDTVASSVTFTLGANVENLVLTGSAKINGTGNNLANILVGNAGKNTLNGGGAADTISGGLGKDKLLGKGGKDMFVFADALGPANADKLKDFKHKKDKIVLDQDIFAAVGTKVGKKEFVEGKKAGDKNDHIIRDGKKVFYDGDGKGGAKQVLFAKIDKKVDLDHKDFMVDDFVI